MCDWKERTALLLGEDKVKTLESNHVLIMGLGGVGAYAAEQIARAGIGEMTIVDGDTIHPSNRNRQLLALQSTEGKGKARLMEQRLLDINPALKTHSIQAYLTEEAIEDLLEQEYDYVVDAIDTLAPKVHLIYHCLDKGYKIVSSMGAGGKIDPSEVQIADISKSYNDNLARMLRKRLHKKGVYSGVKVVFSSEIIDKSAIILVEGEANKKTTVGTLSYMPAIFGNFMASVVIRDLVD